MDNLGDRMKQYEQVPSISLTRRTPVILRIDGRAFHTFTRRMVKPFDKDLHFTMCAAAAEVAKSMQGCKVWYVQSDEASFFLTDYDSFETEPFLGNEVQKLVSIAASSFTASFNIVQCTHAVFDARCFNLPKEEVINYFLWRIKDWKRNSLQMYTRSFFSHKELEGANISKMHELLHSVGKNWADLEGVWKNGTLGVRQEGVWNRITDTAWTYADLAELLHPLIWIAKPKELPIEEKTNAVPA